MMQSDEDQKVMNIKQSYSILSIILILLTTAMVTLLLSAASAYFGGFTASSGEDINGDIIAQRLRLPVIIHLATVIPSIPLGGYILWRKKGDRLHKSLGKIWSAMMMVTAFSAFWIGDRGTGIAGSGFSFIHIFSVVTIISIPLAIFHIKRGNVEGHYMAMQGVYFGLLVAGLFSFMPGRIMNILAFG